MQNENEVVQNDGLLDDPLDDFVDVPEVPTPEPPVIDAADIPQSENIQYPIKNDDYTEQKFPGQVQDFYMNKEVRFRLYPPGAIRRQSPTCDDAVKMGVMHEGLGPCMQNCDKSYLCSQVLGVSCQHLEGLGGCPEKEVVNHLLVS